MRKSRKLIPHENLLAKLWRHQHYQKNNSQKQFEHR